MNEKLIAKWIDNCLADYFGDVDGSPLTNEEINQLIGQVKLEVEQACDADLRMSVHDRVYEYLTKYE